MRSREWGVRSKGKRLLSTSYSRRLGLFIRFHDNTISTRGLGHHGRAAVDAQPHMAQPRLPLIDKSDKRHTIGGMAKRQFKLTEAEVNELKGAYQHCQDGLTKIRYQAVRLYGTGKKVSEIEEICGCSRPSLMEWCQAYRQCGLARLVDQRRGGNRAKLRGIELEQLQQQLAAYTPAQLLGVVNCYGDGQFWTVPDLAKLVERDYQVKYNSDTSYRTLFKRCDFSCQRPGSQYWSRNELAVLDFEQQLEKKL